MRLIGLNIDREKHEYESGKILKEDIELKKYFNPREKNFLLRDNENLILEEKLKMNFYQFLLKKKFLNIKTKLSFYKIMKNMVI